MKIEDYINMYYEGNRSAFGRDFNRSPQHMVKIMQKREQWLVVDQDDITYLLQIRSEKKPCEAL